MAEAVGVGVRVGVGVSVAVGVGVRDGVAEAVGVDVRVGNGVCVGVEVGNHVRVAVGVGVGVDAGAAPKAMKISCRYNGLVAPFVMRTNALPLEVEMVLEIYAVTLHSSVFHRPESVLAKAWVSKDDSPVATSIATVSRAVSRYVRCSVILRAAPGFQSASAAMAITCDALILRACRLNSRCCMLNCDVAFGLGVGCSVALGVGIGVGVPTDKPHGLY